MRRFLMIAAVLIGLANVTVFVLTADKPLEDAFSYFLGDLPQWPLIVLYAVSAVVAGLLVSAVVLGFMRSGLRGSFFARYGVMVLAICLGGVTLSVLLTIVTYSFDGHLTVTKRITWALTTVPFTTIAGGVLGAAEGVILAFPIAAILGRFRTAG